MPWAGFLVFQSFPDTLIYIVEYKLKSKGKDSVLIGLCFGEIGLVK